MIRCGSSFLWISSELLWLVWVEMLMVVIIEVFELWMGAVIERSFFFSFWLMSV